MATCVTVSSLEQAVAAELFAGIRVVGEHLRKLPEEKAFAVRWHVAIVCQGRDETLEVALVPLVDRDGLLHGAIADDDDGLDGQSFSSLVSFSTYHVSPPFPVKSGFKKQGGDSANRPLHRLRGLTGSSTY